jgi:hypothetical protein
MPKKRSNVPDERQGILPEKFDDGSEVRRLIMGRRLSLIPHSVDPKLVFRFELGPAILAQVLEQIEILPIIPLLSEDATGAAYPGFYQLLWQGKSRYIGRAVRPLGKRIREHIKNLRGRIPLDEVGCRFLFVEDRSLVGLSEDTLIAYFYPRGMDEWAKQGFGSKATGHGRAGQSSRWHKAFPTDFNWPVTTSGLARLLHEHVAEIASEAPITFSIPDALKPSFVADFPQPLPIPSQTRPFIDWVSDLERLLHPRWMVDRKPMGWYIVPTNAEPKLETHPEP